MKGLDNNAFELAIVDPPYGINRDGGESGKNWKQYEKKDGIHKAQTRITF